LFPDSVNHYDIANITGEATYVITAMGTSKATKSDMSRMCLEEDGWTKENMRNENIMLARRTQEKKCFRFIVVATQIMKM
jgi:hypothetical protein